MGNLENTINFFLLLLKH